MFDGPLPARIHFIGPLQSNKVVRAVPIFDSIDAVDSLALAERSNGRQLDWQAAADPD